MRSSARTEVRSLAIQHLDAATDMADPAHRRPRRPHTLGAATSLVQEKQFIDLDATPWAQARASISRAGKGSRTSGPAALAVCRTWRSPGFVELALDLIDKLYVQV